MKITIITVSYNANKSIERTIVSVINQKYKDYEYIIIDGNSQDNTVDIIKHYSHKITHWISEPDKGIYNAMNKAVKIATGDYCIFMNAGDIFINPFVLEQVSSHLNDNKDILVGNEISTKNNKIVDYRKAPKAITFNYLFTSSLCHQASFIKRSLLMKYPYDEQLRMVSDWKFWIQTLIFGNATYQAVDIDICIFNREGITFTQGQKGEKERLEVLSSLIPDKILRDYIIFNKRPILYTFFFKIKNKIKRELQIIKTKKKLKRSTYNAVYHL